MRELIDANNFIGVRAVVVAVSAITFVDVAVVADIIAGGIFFIVDGTYGVRGGVSVGYEVMREKLACFNLTGQVMILFSTFQ